tara:strand:+ start:3101 stop:3277 length:177 start_codon:yes stop_codon:yes gene_type:complete
MIGRANHDEEDPLEAPTSWVLKEQIDGRQRFAEANDRQSQRSFAPQCVDRHNRYDNEA